VTDAVSAWVTEFDRHAAACKAIIKGAVQFWDEDLSDLPYRKAKESEKLLVAQLAALKRSGI
jgi:hypothetical protein